MKTLYKLIFLSLFLTTAFVFTSCSDIFGDNSDKGELILKIPSEKSARAVSDYDSYDFTVSITNRDTKVEESKEAKPGQACSFELESGFYNLKISASLSSAPDTILYEGSATDIEVIAGQTTEVPLITLTRLSRSWNIDLSNYIKYIQIVYNKWGPNYESTDIDISNSFDGSLPKAGDTLNFTWKAKSDIDLKTLCMHIANIDFIGKGPGEWVKWTHLISPEDWNIAIASNIKAEEEFEAKASYVASVDSIDFAPVALVRILNDTQALMWGVDALGTGEQLSAFADVPDTVTEGLAILLIGNGAPEALYADDGNFYLPKQD